MVENVLHENTKPANRLSARHNMLWKSKQMGGEVGVSPPQKNLSCASVAAIWATKSISDRGIEEKNLPRS